MQFINSYRDSNLAKECDFEHSVEVFESNEASWSVLIKIKDESSRS